MRTDIEIDDSDIEGLWVECYDAECFINEIERGSDAKHCVLLDRKAAIQVRDVLNKFIAASNAA